MIPSKHRFQLSGQAIALRGNVASAVGQMIENGISVNSLAETYPRSKLFETLRSMSNTKIQNNAANQSSNSTE
jgi:hypothetical protein